MLFCDDEGIMHRKRDDAFAIHLHEDLPTDFGIDILERHADAAVEIGFDIRVPRRDVEDQPFCGVSISAQILGNCAARFLEVLGVQEGIERFLDDIAIPSGNSVRISLQVPPGNAVEQAGMDLLIVEFDRAVSVDGEVLPMRFSARLPPASIEPSAAIPAAVVKRGTGMSFRGTRSSRQGGSH